MLIASDGLSARTAGLGSVSGSVPGKHSFDIEKAEKNSGQVAHEDWKRRRVDAAADRFIERWHERLDLKVLYEEQFVSGPQLRSTMAAGFREYVVGQLGCDSSADIDQDVDEMLIRQVFFESLNCFFLHYEYELAFEEGEEKDDDEGELEIPELAEVRDKFEVILTEHKKGSRRQLELFVESATYLASSYRRHLAPEVFTSARYADNLGQREEDELLVGGPDEIRRAKTDAERLRFTILHGFSRFEVPDSVEVYRLTRGAFELYLMEEAGEVKVLTIDFEG
jgi:hypothetical protein